MKAATPLPPWTTAEIPVTAKRSKNSFTGPPSHSKPIAVAAVGVLRLDCHHHYRSWLSSKSTIAPASTASVILIQLQGRRPEMLPVTPFTTTW
jgi:hypothetical protein